MEKMMVVLTNPAKEDNMLIACLHVLFPECKILVQSSLEKDIRDPNVLGEVPWIIREEKNGKHPPL